MEMSRRISQIEDSKSLFFEQMHTCNTWNQPWHFDFPACSDNIDTICTFNKYPN